MTQKFKLNKITSLTPSILLEQKLYRIFKKQYCQFFSGSSTTKNSAEPSSYLYYFGQFNGSVKNYLIGELMFGENLVTFFKRKHIFIVENIQGYTFVQQDLILASYTKDWIETQPTY